MAWAQVFGMKGQKMPPIRKPENQLRRQNGIQGVARTQVFGIKGKNWVRLAKNAQTKLILSLIFDIHNLKSSCHCLARRPRAQQRRRWLPVPTRICMSCTVTGSAPSSTCLRGCRRVTVKQGARVVHKTRTALARLMHARVALGTCERGAHED